MKIIKGDSKITLPEKTSTGGITSKKSKIVRGFKVASLVKNPNKDMWGNIKEWDEDIQKVDPVGYKGFLKEVKIQRAMHDMDRTKGFTKTKTRKHELRLPYSMGVAIKKYYPELFENQSLVEKLGRVMIKYHV